MSRKVKIIIVAVAVVVLLVLGGTAAVLAREAPPSPSRYGASLASSNQTANDMLSRVAVILGITRERLAGAFGQARQDISAEAVVKAVDNAVTKGLITKAEADTVKAWWAQRPDAANKLLQVAPGFKGMAPHMGRFMYGGNITAALDQAVAKGIITADDRAKTLAWWGQRPAVLDKLVQTGIGAKRIVPPTAFSGNITAAVDQAVTRGLITKADADSIKAWWEQRPDAANKLLQVAPGFNGMAPRMGRFMYGGNITAALDQAVAKGIITADDKAKTLAWWGQRPAVLDKLPQNVRLALPKPNRSPDVPKWRVTPKGVRPTGA